GMAQIVAPPDVEESALAQRAQQFRCPWAAGAVHPRRPDDHQVESGAFRSSARNGFARCFGALVVVFGSQRRVLVRRRRRYVAVCMSIARTDHPRELRYRMRWEPMKPPAPVTSARVAVISAWLRQPRRHSHRGPG